MPTKIRLQRKGKKGQPFYHIVIADGRAPREGRFIERIGTYNPLAKPAEIELDFDKTLDWLQKGAQPTDTARAILTFKGVMYKAHLLKGVKKGAMTPEQAEAKFQEWSTAKQEKVNTSIKAESLNLKESLKSAMAYEKEVNEKKANEIAKKMAKAAKAEADARHVAEEVPAEVPVEVPAEVPAEAPAEVVAEVTDEAPVEVTTEVPVEIPAEMPAEIPAEAPEAPETPEAPEETTTEEPKA